MVVQNSLLIREFLKNFYVSNKALQKAQKKCPVYLKLSWIGKNSLKFERKIKLSIDNCFEAVQPRVVFPPNEFYLLYMKTFFPLFNKVTSYMNTCATSIVGTCVERLNVCRTASASMCQNLFETELVSTIRFPFISLRINFHHSSKT